MSKPIITPSLDPARPAHFQVWFHDQWNEVSAPKLTVGLCQQLIQLYSYSIWRILDPTTRDVLAQSEFQPE